MRDHIIKAVLYENMSVKWANAEEENDVGVNVHLNVHQKTRQIVEAQLGDFVLNIGDTILVAFEKVEEGNIYHENPRAMERDLTDLRIFRAAIPALVHNTPGEWGVQFYLVTNYDPATGDYEQCYPFDIVTFREGSSFLDDGLTVPAKENFSAIYSESQLAAQTALNASMMSEASAAQARQSMQAAEAAATQAEAAKAGTEAYLGEAQVLANEISDLHAIQEQAGIVTVTEIEDAYSSRETANGANIYDGVSTNIKAIRGATVRDTATNTLKNSYFKGLKSTGRNLFDIANPMHVCRLAGDVNNYILVEDGVVYNGGVSGQTAGAMLAFKNEGTNSYTISGKITESKVYTYEIHNFDNIENGMAVGDTKLSQGGGSGDLLATFSTSKKYFGICIYAAAKHSVGFDGFQCQFGAATPFEPYVEDALELADPIELTEWDTAYPEENKIVRKSNTIVFDTEAKINAWSLYGGSTDNRKIYTYPVDKRSADTISFYCSHFQYAPNSNISTNLTGGNPTSGYSLIQMDVKVASDTAYIDNLDKFKEYLRTLANEGNPLIYEYLTINTTEDIVDFPRTSYTAWKDGSETVIQGDIDNSEYGAECTVTQEYLTKTEA